MNIFIRRDNDEYGPLGREEVFALLFRRELSNDDLARTDLDGSWRPLREVLRASATGLHLPGEEPMSRVLAEPSLGPPSPTFQNEEEMGFENTMEASALPEDLSAGESNPLHIFILRNGIEDGPFSASEVEALFVRGELGAAEYLRAEGNTEWETVATCFGIEEATTGMEAEAATAGFTPPPSQYPSNRGATAGLAPKPVRSRVNETRFILFAGVVGMILAFAAAFIFERQKGPDLLPETQVGQVISHASLKPNIAPAKIVDSPNQSVDVGEASTNERKDLVPIELKRTAPMLAQNKAQAKVPIPIKAAIPGPTRKRPSAQVESLLAKVRQIKLPATPKDISAQLWVADTNLKPRGVLVLCSGGGRPDIAIKDQVWQKFAIDNQLALAAISFSSAPNLLKTGGGYYHVDQGSGDVLLSGLGQAYGKTLPVILYGQGGGGTYVANFAAWKPGQIIFWAAYTDDWRLKVSAAGAIPAIIACDQDDSQGLAQGKQVFSQARLQNKPWTWLPLHTAWKDRGTAMDGFVRNYTAVILSGSGSNVASNGKWAAIDSKREMGSAERFAQPDRASWLPNSEVFQQWLTLMGPSAETEKPIIIEKDVATRNPNQPILKLFLRLPSGAKDGKGVNGVLSYCTWENNEADIISKLSSQSNGKPGSTAALVVPFLAFAEQHNLAVLTWGTVSVWNKNLNTEEMERKQQEEFNRNFELLANAWARGVADLGRDTGIPQKDFLLYGISRGAQWAQRLALRKPDYFLAVHVHIPSTFDKPTPEASKPLWLLTTGEREYGYEGAQRFYHECSTLGYPIIFKAIVGLGHADSTVEHALGFKFFEYALSLKDARNAWIASVSDPLGSQKSQGKAGPLWLTSFNSPAFYGDFLNQECYPAKQSDMIPVALRVPLPTKELAELWNK